MFCLEMKMEKMKKMKMKMGRLVFGRWEIRRPIAALNDRKPAVEEVN